MFELAARLISTFYAWTHNYALAIGLVAVVVMLLITPLTLKSTRGMLNMQRLQPELRKLQIEHKGDRQGLNEAMMKLSEDHRTVVTLYDIQGHQHAEISRMLGVSEGTVRSRLFYAHRQLQAYLEDFVK